MFGQKWNTDLMWADLAKGQISNTRVIPCQVIKCMVLDEFLILMKLGLFTFCYVLNTVLSNPALLRIQSTETCGMQVALCLVVVSAYLEKYLMSKTSRRIWMKFSSYVTHMRSYLMM
jgi:hypothetical protein